MMDIIRQYAAMPLKEAMKMPEYQELRRSFSEEDQAFFKRKENIERQRIRDYADFKPKTVDADCLKYNIEMINNKGYGSAECIIAEKSGGGAQPLDAKGILGLSKFVYNTYINNENEASISILQVPFFSLFICSF